MRAPAVDVVTRPGARWNRVLRGDFNTPGDNSEIVALRYADLFLFCLSRELSLQVIGERVVRGR